MTDCGKYQEMISAMLDGELDESDKAELEDHIAVCDKCKMMYEAFLMLSDGLGQPVNEPADLHEKIMNGVNAAAKKKKGMITRLRPYAVAAACLVAVVGAVLALRPGMSGTNTAPTMYKAFAADTAESRGTGESGGAYFAAGNSMADSAEASEECAPEACDTGAAPSAVFVPGEEITAARILSGDEAEYTKISDPVPLTAALCEQSSDAVNGFGEIKSVLEVETESGVFVLNIIFDPNGESVWVETAEGNIYLAAGKQSTFAEIN